MVSTLDSKTTLFSLLLLITTSLYPYNSGETVTADSVGKPWIKEQNSRYIIDGMLQFRGNPTHTYYGKGPIPVNIKKKWRYPKKPMAAYSWEGKRKRHWAGTGWTGQPVVYQRKDGITEIIVGAYDKCVHFINLETGKPTRKRFCTKDIIKGSVVLDPDGFPLLYFGSRDNYYRIVALDRKRPKVLFKIQGHTKDRQWNNDWDSSGSIVNNILYIGCENSWFYGYKLNRSYNKDHKVIIKPELKFRIPGWDQELLDLAGDDMVSIESSPAIFENRAYFTNSGGRITGIDITHIHNTNYKPKIVFDYWVGDDTDASLVIDQAGMLYIGVELERKRRLPRGRQKMMGQILKVNPYIFYDRHNRYVGSRKTPRIWGISLPRSQKDQKGGIWATLALHKNVLYVPTHTGQLLTIDQKNGTILSNIDVGWHAWSSPVVVNNRLLVGTTTWVKDGKKRHKIPPGIRVFDITTPENPIEIVNDRIKVYAAVESTPVVWKNNIIFGCRDGFIYNFSGTPPVISLFKKLDHYRYFFIGGLVTLTHPAGGLQWYSALILNQIRTNSQKVATIQ